MTGSIQNLPPDPPLRRWRRQSGVHGVFVSTSEAGAREKAAQVWPEALTVTGVEQMHEVKTAHPTFGQDLPRTSDLAELRIVGGQHRYVSLEGR